MLIYFPNFQSSTARSNQGTATATEFSVCLISMTTTTTPWPPLRNKNLQVKRLLLTKISCLKHTTKWKSNLWSIQNGLSYPELPIRYKILRLVLTFRRGRQTKRWQNGKSQPQDCFLLCPFRTCAWLRSDSTLTWFHACKALCQKNWFKIF